MAEQNRVGRVGGVKTWSSYERALCIRKEPLRSQSHLMAHSRDTYWSL
jgi:hypothetical protein